MQIQAFSGVKQSKIYAVLFRHCFPRLWLWPGRILNADVSGSDSAVITVLVARWVLAHPFAGQPCDSVHSQPLGAELRNSQGHLHPSDNKTHAAWNKIIKEQMAVGQAVVCLICPCLWGSNCLLRPWKWSKANTATAISTAHMTLFTEVMWSLGSRDPCLAEFSCL